MIGRDVELDCNDSNQEEVFRLSHSKLPRKDICLEFVTELCTEWLMAFVLLTNLEAHMHEAVESLLMV